MATFFKSTGRALQYIVGVGFWNLCMLIVIATLCFIAIPKDFSDPISCRLFNVHCLPKSATSLPLIAPQ
jgi:hypothetical protein